MVVKRIFDIFASAVGILLLSPLLIAIAITIKIDTTGPVFFRQIRIGRLGKAFKIFKFRTMLNNAEKLGLQITIGKDSRISRVGHVLRHYKIDELPQLFNVLLGDMSLVGPRPEVPKYVELYPKLIRDKVLSVRPGITDLASVEFKDENMLLQNSNNPEETYKTIILPRKLEHYQAYVNTRSFFGDILIICKTLSAILR